MTLAGLPHSGISGSTPACGSPELIAANHALHRLLAPRHPSCALSSLTIYPFGRLTACRVKARVQLKNADPTVVGRKPPRRFANRTVRRAVALERRPLDASSFASSFVYSIFKEAAFNNGGNGTRTRDPRLAKPMLYQLSYSPA